MACDDRSCVIILRITQRRIKIDNEWITMTADKIMSAAGYAGWGVGIWITTNKTIKQYNATYRHKDKPTDILSFPFYPKLKPGKRPKAVEPDDFYLGDIIISAERVEKDALDLHVTFDERMTVLLVHGICHLLGYDHETEAQFRVMHAREEELLGALTRIR